MHGHIRKICSKNHAADAIRGIVKSVRGIAGGHMLARTPDEITLADIIYAVEGGISLPGVSNTAPRGKTALDAWDMVARSMNSSLEADSRLRSAEQCFSASARHPPQGGSTFFSARVGDRFWRHQCKSTFSGRQRCRKPKQTVTNPSTV